MLKSNVNIDKHLTNSNPPQKAAVIKRIAKIKI